MSRAIERGKALTLEMIDGLQQEIEETGLTECFKDYLVEQNYVSDDERVSLPNAAKDMCDRLVSRCGWDMFYTADILFDFGKRSGMLPPDRDGDLRRAFGKSHGWQRAGF